MNRDLAGLADDAAAAAAGYDPGAFTDIADLDGVPFSSLGLPPSPGDDLRIVVHALSAVSLEAAQVGGSWRVRRAPPVGEVVVDFGRGEVSAPARGVGYEPAPPRYALPPLGREDRHTCTLDDVSSAALEAVARRLLDSGG